MLMRPASSKEEQIKWTAKNPDCPHYDSNYIISHVAKWCKYSKNLKLSFATTSRNIDSFNTEDGI